MAVKMDRDIYISLHSSNSNTVVVFLWNCSTNSTDKTRELKTIKMVRMTFSSSHSDLYVGVISTTVWCMAVRPDLWKLSMNWRWNTLKWVWSDGCVGLSWMRGRKWRTQTTLRIGTSQSDYQKRVGWDGLDMLNEKMIMTGSNVV